MRYVVILLVAILTACATTPAPTPDPTPASDPLPGWDWSGTEPCDRGFTMLPSDQEGKIVVVPVLLCPAKKPSY